MGEAAKRIYLGTDESTVDTSKHEPSYDGPSEHEVFSFIFRSWDVNEAWKIIQAKKRKNKIMVPIEEIKQYFGYVKVNKAYADKIDLSKIQPLIAVTLKDEDGGKFALVIDGWHRIYKAMKSGVKELPAYLLTLREERQVMIKTRWMK